MLRRLFISLVAWSLAAVGPVSAALGADMAVVTGGEKGTYYQFGLNLQALGKLNGINLSVYPSKGSVENIYAVYQRPGVQVGIVQSDVLAFVAKVQTDQTLQRIAKKIKMVFPLYNEEVHLLARKGINSFDDLAGKRVAIGREGSGTYLTVRLLFKVSEVTPREMCRSIPMGRWPSSGRGGSTRCSSSRGTQCGSLPKASPRRTISCSSRSPTKISPSSTRPSRSPPTRTPGNPSPSRLSRSRRSSCRSTIGGAIATTWD